VLLTSRHLYVTLGGFNEEHLPVNFQDVDYSLRLWRHGYRVVYTPFAKLHHLESQTRRTEVAAYGYNYIRETWGGTLENDPFYSPNLSMSPRRESSSDL
jgi:GT2 family glycosyltransferase